MRSKDVERRKLSGKRNSIGRSDFEVIANDLSH